MQWFQMFSKRNRHIRGAAVVRENGTSFESQSITERAPQTGERSTRWSEILAGQWLRGELSSHELLLYGRDSSAAAAAQGTSAMRAADILRVFALNQERQRDDLDTHKQPSSMLPLSHKDVERLLTIHNKREEGGGVTGKESPVVKKDTRKDENEPQPVVLPSFAPLQRGQSFRRTSSSSSVGNANTLGSPTAASSTSCTGLELCPAHWVDRVDLFAVTPSLHFSPASPIITPHHHLPFRLSVLTTELSYLLDPWLVMALVDELRKGNNSQREKSNAFADSVTVRLFTALFVHCKELYQRQQEGSTSEAEISVATTRSTTHNIHQFLPLLRFVALLSPLKHALAWGRVSEAHAKDVPAASTPTLSYQQFTSLTKQPHTQSQPPQRLQFVDHRQLEGVLTSFHPSSVSTQQVESEKLDKTKSNSQKLSQLAATMAAMSSSDPTRTVDSGSTRHPFAAPHKALFDFSGEYEDEDDDDFFGGSILQVQKMRHQQSTHPQSWQHQRSQPHTFKSSLPSSTPHTNHERTAPPLSSRPNNPFNDECRNESDSDDSGCGVFRDVGDDEEEEGSEVEATEVADTRTAARKDESGDVKVGITSPALNKESKPDSIHPQQVACQEWKERELQGLHVRLERVCLMNDTPPGELLNKGGEEVTNDLPSLLSNILLESSPKVNASTKEAPTTVTTDILLQSFFLASEGSALPVALCLIKHKEWPVLCALSVRALAVAAAVSTVVPSVSTASTERGTTATSDNEKETSSLLLSSPCLSSYYSVGRGQFSLDHDAIRLSEAKNEEDMHAVSAKGWASLTRTLLSATVDATNSSYPADAVAQSRALLNEIEEIERTQVCMTSSIDTEDETDLKDQLFSFVQAQLRHMQRVEAAILFKTVVRVLLSLNEDSANTLLLQLVQCTTSLRSGNGNGSRDGRGSSRGGVSDTRKDDDEAQKPLSIPAETVREWVEAYSTSVVQRYKVLHRL